MLIPRYSLRWLLGLITFSAVVSLVLSYAVRGAPWAVGVAAGLWSLVLVGLSYVMAFLAAWLIDQSLATLRSRSSRIKGESPFAPMSADESPFIEPGRVAAQQAAEAPPPITG